MTKYLLDPKHTDPKRVAHERDCARELRKSGWWKAKIAPGICHYCQKKYRPTELTMDHIVPIARGGESKQGNVVPACKACNQSKKLDTPVDALFEQLEQEKLRKNQSE